MIKTKKKVKRKTPTRRGIYVRDIPLDEIGDVAGKLGLPPEAVIGMLLRTFAGKVGESVSRLVTDQLGLFSDEQKRGGDDLILPADEQPVDGQVDDHGNPT